MIAMIATAMISTIYPVSKTKNYSKSVEDNYIKLALPERKLVVCGIVGAGVTVKNYTIIDAKTHMVCNIARLT